jgi:hypothetical protein
MMDDFTVQVSTTHAPASKMADLTVQVSVKMEVSDDEDDKGGVPLYDATESTALEQHEYFQDFSSVTKDDALLWQLPQVHHRSFNLTITC